MPTAAGKGGEGPDARHHMAQSEMRHSRKVLDMIPAKGIEPAIVERLKDIL